MDEEQQAAPDGLRPAAAYAGPDLAPAPDWNPPSLLAASDGPVPWPMPAPAAVRLRVEREQDYFNDIYLLAPVGYFVLALDTTVLLMNLVGADLLGIPRTNPQRQRLRNFIAERFLLDFDAFVSAALTSREPQRCQLQMTRGRGDRGFPVTLLASGSGDGQSFRVVLELAEGKLAALERSEERFRRIVHNAEEGIWEVDAAARTSFVNPKMAQMLGYSIDEMLEQPLQYFMDEEGRNLFERNIASRLRGVAERYDFKFRRKNGEELWASLSTNPIFDGDGSYLGALALVTDITAQRQSSEEVWRQANFDALTGLPNRHMFHDRLGQEMKKAKRDNMFLALLFIDLDQFKQVNDRLGHAMGDRLLAEAAARIGACVRASDTLARLGGDEFVVILPGLEHAASVERVAQNIIAALNQPFLLAREQGRVSASVGIALFPSDAAEPADLLSHADQAMYAAKGGGRNRYCYFTADMQAAAQQRLRLSGDLRQALEAGQFQLYYQPIVNLRTGRIERAEALLRWHHPQRGLLNPPEFIANAEASGLIVDIGDWVFRQAADQAQAWQRELGWPLQISVNQSPVQFRGDPSFCQGWLDYVSQLQLAPRSIVIEITESVLSEAASPVLERLRQFRAMGLQVALDDFGTGHGSLAHLKQFELDYLKIDRSFVQGLSGDSGGLALCEAIIVMAHKLGLQVVAEGVESEVQLALLKAAGCDYAQGFVYAHALPPAELAAMVAREAGAKQPI